MTKSFTDFEFLLRNKIEIFDKAIRILANLFTTKENSMEFLSNN